MTWRTPHRGTLKLVAILAGIYAVVWAVWSYGPGVVRGIARLVTGGGF